VSEIIETKLLTSGF